MTARGGVNVLGGVAVSITLTQGRLQGGEPRGPRNVVVRRSLRDGPHARRPARARFVHAICRISSAACRRCRRIPDGPDRHQMASRTPW
jgi:hypothetical protein